MLRSLAISLLLTAASRPALSAGVMVGQPVPDFSVTTVEGQRVDISDLRGKRVLVFLWASW